MFTELRENKRMHAQKGMIIEPNQSIENKKTLIEIANQRIQDIQSKLQEEKAFKCHRPERIAHLERMIVMQKEFIARQQESIELLGFQNSKIKQEFDRMDKIKELLKTTGKQQKQQGE